MYQGKFATGEKPAKQKKPVQATTGTKIFYGVYAGLIVLFFIGLSIALLSLRGWLVDYEASQPDTKAQQVFDQLFADPDWGEIYTAAKLEETKFETKDTYAAYMEQKVGNAQLHYVKTSAGLSGGQKYIVKLGNEKLATFTLSNGAASDLDIPKWELNTVELFVTRSASVTIRTQPDRKITVNGVALDDSYIIQTTSTAAQSYLPDGIQGARTVTYHVDSLLVAPTVSAVDANGKAVELVYDAASCSYTEVMPTHQIQEDQKAALLNAAQTYCKYMISGGSTTQLRKYFDSTSNIYKTILKNEMWVRGYTGYTFSPEQVTDFYSYTDKLFSAKLTMTMNVTRTNGTVKEYPLSNTFFMEQQTNGSWLVIEMVNVNAQDVLEQVRLTYTQDGQVLSSEMVDTSVKSLTPPAVSIPEGKVFTGWFRETVDENGDKTLSLVFAPDESGKVTLPADYSLQSMTLQALFENKEA